MPETQQPPLAGIKVVDLTRYLAGPFCTQILGDYGAEILKIEPVENPRGELGGIFSAQGILLALEARHRDGRGQRVETSLLESIVSILTWSAGIYFETGKTPAPAGNNHPLSSPHGVFKASDRPFNIACGNEAMWKNFVSVIGRPELADDDRFKSSGRRIKNRSELTEEINRALASHPAEHWIQLLNREGIPSGPILTIEEMFKHPQTAAREMLLKLPHPELGEYLTTGLAAKLEATPGKITRPPLVGEHTDEVLTAYGYSPEDLKRLRAGGGIA